MPLQLSSLYVFTHKKSFVYFISRTQIKTIQLVFGWAKDLSGTKILPKKWNLKRSYMVKIHS